MTFNEHFNLKGKHAILSASSWRWIKDDPESLLKRVTSQYATSIGTILHDVARKYIQHGVKMNRYDKKSVMLELLENGIPGTIIDNLDFDSMYDNLMAYVNDGVGFRMVPEVVLRYSDNIFGTTDCIQYSEKESVLRISDYKSGSTPAHMEQLIIYAALFCLEYRIKPSSIKRFELRIYQGCEIDYCEPDHCDISSVIDTIVDHDKLISKIKED